jgi:hypothetical protein
MIVTHFKPEDEGSTVLRNTGMQPPRYTARQTRKTQILMLSLFLTKFCTLKEHIICN